MQEPLLPGEEPREGDEPRLDHIGVDGVVEAEVVHCLGSHELGTFWLGLGIGIGLGLGLGSHELGT